MSIIDPVLDSIDTFLAWLSVSLKQTTESYCDLETADSQHVLVAHDGSLVSISKIDGSKAFRRTQNVLAPIPDLRDPHDSFVRATLNDLGGLNVHAELLDVHEAVYEMRKVADPDATDPNWKAVLPGDKITVKEYQNYSGEISD